MILAQSNRNRTLGRLFSLNQNCARIIDHLRDIFGIHPCPTTAAFDLYI
jgi:hypothetical protein